MINNNINIQKQLSTEQTTAITSNSCSAEQLIKIIKTVINHCNNKIFNPNIKDIQDYQINKQTEIKLFSEMQPGIPSTLDFLTLCRANNQQLAADKLNTMLSKVWKPCLFKWKTNVINENNFELPHNDYIIATPLSLAAKYGNTAICKVLIEKRQHQLSLSTKTLFYLYDKKFITN